MNNQNISNVNIDNLTQMRAREMESGRTQNINQPTFSPGMGNSGNIDLAKLSQPFVITGPTSGTSIAKLKGVHPGNGRPNDLQQPKGAMSNASDQRNQPRHYSQQNPQQHAQEHSPKYQPYQTQHQLQPRQTDQRIQQKRLNDNISFDGISMINNDEINNIKHLVKNINKGLVGYGPSKTLYSENSENSENSDDYSDNLDNSSDGVNSKQSENKKKSVTNESLIFSCVKELVLILFLYIIISQGFVKRCVNTAIPGIAFDDLGNTTFTGNIMYGSILASSVVFFRRVLL